MLRAKTKQTYQVDWVTDTELLGVHILGSMLLFFLH